jgi:hypothetical protein
MTFIWDTDHVYILYCRAGTHPALDLAHGSTENGTPCQGWNDLSNSDNPFCQQWLISKVVGGHDVYTLRNLRSGMYLDLNHGSSHDGTKIQGWNKARSADTQTHQQWKIIRVGEYYRLQNVASGTYMDLDCGDSTPGTKIQGWQYYNTVNQEWRLVRVSRTGHEINTIAECNRHIGTHFKNYHADRVYIVLRKSVRDYIYQRTGLNKIHQRPELFDCHDYAFVAKAEFAKWGRDNLRADGFAILFGIMFGTTVNGHKHACNWYLTDDLTAIAFFDPQTGNDTHDITYQAAFGIF